MKNLYVIFFTVFTAFSCSQPEYNFKLNGTAEGIESGTVYLQKFRNKTFYTIDSAKIAQEKFAFSKNLELPEIYGLTLDTTKNSFLVFFDENPITVFLDSARYYRNTKVTGSELQDLYTETRQHPDIAIDSLIREHPNSLVSAYILYRYFSYRLPPAELEANIKLLDPALRETPYIKTLEKLIPTLEEVTVGKEAPDFTGSDPDGNAISFSDHLGEGYVLLNFWASWCGPCRRENPNVVHTYEKYKDKGLRIFGVSLDKNREGWISAIEKDHLTWSHVSDLSMWDSELAGLYGVRVIPSNFLIDQNGVIVAKNLRGEDLDRTLSEILN